MIRHPVAYIVLSVLLVLLSPSVGYGQETPETEATVSVSTDAGGSETLTFGLDPDATDGIDSQFGEMELPPVPPSGAFDARWIDNDIAPSTFGEGILIDIRQGSSSSNGTRQHEVQFQTKDSATEVVIEWDLPAGVTGTIEDKLDGAVYGPVDMEKSESLTVDPDDPDAILTIKYNAPPTASDDSAQTTEGQPTTTDVLANDSDDGNDIDASTVTVQSGPSDGTTAVNNDGTVTYDPDAGFAGTDSYTYTVADTDGARSGEATVTISVEANEAPTAGFTVDPSEPTVGETVTFDASGSSDDGSVVEYRWDFDDDGQADATGEVVDHVFSSAGEKAVALTVEDDDGATAEATETVPVNAPPVAEGDTSQTGEGDPVETDVLENDADPDGSLDVSSVQVGTGPSDGTIAGVDEQTGAVTYAPGDGFSGTDSYTYTVADTDGARSGEATVTISVEANEAPTAGFTVDPSEPTVGQAVSFDGSASSDEDGQVAEYRWDFDDDGQADATGEVVDHVFSSAGEKAVALTVEDDDGAESGEATVTITVNEANQAPTASDDSVQTTEGQPTTTDVLANDSDDGNDIDASTVTVQSGPSDGTTAVNNDGTVTYDPDAGFSGTDSYTYTVADTDGAESGEATVTIEVVENAPPTASVSFDPDVPEVGAPVTFDGSGSSDPEGTVMEYRWGFDGDGQTKATGPTVSTSFESAGEKTVSLTVEDEGGATDEATITVAVNAPPEIANTIPDETLQSPGPPLRLVGLTTTVFHDPDGDALALSARSSGSSVVEVIDGSEPQVVTIQPEASGTADVTVTASDGTVEASTSFEVTVEPREGEKPVAQASAVVNSDGEGQPLGFGDTGAGIVFSSTSGSGRVAVERFDTPPDDEEIGRGNVSDFRWTVKAGDNLGFDSAELRIGVGSVGGITEPSSVTIYKRETPGTGSFAPLTPTDVDDNGTPDDISDDTLSVTTDSFSEFVFASDTNALPVELASFDGTAIDGSVRLTWQTASETNSAGFEVQRRESENAGWRPIGYVESKAEGGTTTDAQSYRYTAENLPAGTHQFRLKQVDLDGRSTLIDPVSVEVRMQEAAKLMGPAPNPASTSATFSFAVQEQVETTIRLYNVLGQRVATLYNGTPQAGEEQRARIDATGLQSGVYFLRLEAGGQMRTRKLTVVR